MIMCYTAEKELPFTLRLAKSCKSTPLCKTLSWEKTCMFGMKYGVIISAVKREKETLTEVRQLLLSVDPNAKPIYTVL